jgi:hypothetical protein
MRRTRKQGGNRPLPLQYFGDAAPVSASAGVDRLDITGNMVRPTIGGQRSIRSMRKKRGGFYPTVMGNFVPAASKYITPLALFAAYKLMKKSQHTKKKRRSRRKQSKRT